MNRAVRLIGILPAAALLFGLAAATPARADDRQTQRDRDHARREVADLRRDERKLADLQDRRDHQAFRHDWRGVRDTDRQIDALRFRIDRQRDEVRRDFARFRFDRSHEDEAEFGAYRGNYPNNRDNRDYRDNGDYRTDRYRRDNRPF